MGVAAALGAYLVLLLSARGHEVIVPDFSTMTIEQAEEEALRHELVPTVSSRQPDPRIAEGRVFAQEPRAGARTRPGRTVKLSVSLGQGTIDVPSLVGESLRKAQLTLEQSGLRAGSVAYAPSAGAPPDLVLAQRPAPGARRSSGDPVSMLVSRGAAERIYVMPDLVGMHIDATTTVLSDHGVRAGVSRRFAPAAPSGTVLDQRPPAGWPLRARQAVSLGVAE